MQAPFVIVQEMIDRDTWWASMVTAPRHLQMVQACTHCWHSPRAWQGPLPAPQTCCWCGASEGPQHGPYAPGAPHG
jgi:hypothetical protein